MNSLKMMCQFYDPKSGQRSHPFSGSPAELIGSIEELRKLYHEQQNFDEDEDYSKRFDENLVLVLFEDTGDAEPFPSRRPFLTVPNFVSAVSNLLKNSEEEVA